MDDIRGCIHALISRSSGNLRPAILNLYGLHSLQRTAEQSRFQISLKPAYRENSNPNIPEALNWRSSPLTLLDPMEQSLRFCDFTDAEFAGLSQELSAAFEFSPESLLAQYARWRSNFLTGGVVEDLPLRYKSSQPQFQEFVEASQVVGVDLPITLSYNKASAPCPIVMLVAQDPRRDPQSARAERITLGTPFALHVPWGRQHGVNTRLVYQAVQLWLEKGWKAYLTDVIKLYAFDEAKGKVRNLPQSDRSRFSTLLAAEIALFQPEVIVTIGTPAYHAVQQIQPSARTIAVPHFSGANQGKWKKLLESGQRITNEAKLAWYCQTVENTGVIGNGEISYVNLDQ